MPWYFYMLIVLILIIIGLIILYFQFIKTFTHKKRMQTSIDNGGMFKDYIDIIKRNKTYLETVEKEEVSTTSFDNLELKGDLMGQSDKKFLLFFHGYKSSYKKDLGNAKSYLDKGYSILGVNQRAHGKSAGKYITFGVKERYDVISWINYLIGRFGSDISILMAGVSMGASTCMMASGLNLPPQVKGMICDCGFTSPKQEISHCVKHYFKIPAFPLVNILNLYCKIFAKFGLSDVSCIDELKKSKTPILMVHGDGDDFVPYSCSVENFKSCNMECKEFLTIKCNVHAVSYLENTALYQEKIDNFLKNINF